MKAEERHELKENELKNWMQYGFPVWIKNNGSYLLLGAAVLVLAYQVWNYYEKKNLVQIQEAWNELYATDAPGVENKPIKLQAIIDQYDSKPLKALALRALGNAYLEAVATGKTDEGATPGVAPAAVDKDDTLNRAQSAYERIVNEFPDQTLALGAAKLGLAVVAEDRGEWDSAKKQYEALTDKSSPFAGTAVALDAANKLATLDKRKTAPPLAAMEPSTAPATMPQFPFSHEGPETGRLPTTSASTQITATPPTTQTTPATTPAAAPTTKPAP